MKEWGKPQYGQAIGQNKLYVSYGGSCEELRNDHNHLQANMLSHFQGHHIEANTLVAFHTSRISKGNILVRSSDTDVFISLLGYCGRSERASIIMDFGSGNNRRYIDVFKIAALLEEKQPGITEELIGLHALTG